MKVCAECGACSEDAYDLCAFDGGLLREVFPGPRVLEGRYLLEQRVAGGAMGEVFRAMHLQVGSTVAVKVMQPQKGELRVGVQRFHREAQILGQIKHPNAVLVMDFGIEERGTIPVPYLVTEFLRGQALHDVMQGRPPFSLEDAEPIVSALCSAVDEAHSVGVIHRDIKPANVFVEELRDRTKIVKVLDFGIAKFVELAPEVKARLAVEGHPAHPLLEDETLDLWDEVAEVSAGSTINERRGDVPTESESDEAPPPAPDRTLTEAGFMIGTIPYMAPEQMTGERVSRTTDVFAIATVMFEMIAGQRPFGGGDDDVINAKVSDERPSLRDFGVAVSEKFDAFVQSCFALEPGERPGSVLQVAEALKSEIARNAGPTDEDVPLALSVQLSVVGRILEQLEHTIRSLTGHDEEAYQATRDRMLALSAPLERVLQLATRIGSAAINDDHRQATSQLVEAQRHVAASLREVESRVPPELVEYLTAIWASLQKRLDRSLVILRPSAAPVPVDLPPVSRVNPFADGLDDDDRDVEQLAALLASKDPLDRIDALDTLLSEKLDRVLALVAQAVHDPTPTALSLIAGLAAHADAVLLAELYPQDRSFRLLPLLANLTQVPEAAPFVVLAQIFKTAPRGEATAQFLVDEALQHAQHDVHRDIIWRCLLVHPLQVVRVEAASRVPLSSLWTVITYPRTPLSTLRAVFDAVQDRAPAEYLKIFFLCVRGSLADAQTSHDVEEALLLLDRLYRLPCFAEDVVFEPLLEVDQGLRRRARTLGAEHLLRDEYLDNANAFTARGATPTQDLQHMRDVPLAVQRKIAREGLFLSYFVAHTHERVAKETVPHLLRLEDVTPFLRISSIHRVVLVALSKKRRFFRRDAPRLALLQNPKTPAQVARIYLPLVPLEQVRLLSLNKHIGHDVRSLARAYVERIARRKQDDMS